MKKKKSARQDIVTLLKRIRVLEIYNSEIARAGNQLRGERDVLKIEVDYLRQRYAALLGSGHSIRKHMIGMGDGDSTGEIDGPSVEDIDKIRETWDIGRQMYHVSGGENGWTSEPAEVDE